MLRFSPDSRVETPASLQEHFGLFREHTIGIRHSITTPYGRIPMLYADWTASGRLYEPIERRMQDMFGPYVANPHTESNTTSLTMTLAYEEARRIIKQHVNASSQDALLFCGYGTTGAINKLQRILGLKCPEWLQGEPPYTSQDRPVIFISHMEHHSNLLPWQESIADVVMVPPDTNGQVDPEQLDDLLQQYRHRSYKFGSFTACSNVTGIETPYHKLAAVMHRHGGYCFVDFAASAPYTAIDMHPPNHLERLDAIFFSPHKFLGGPGTGGILIFNTELYSSHLPDEPGGGTVVWVNPWGGRRYTGDIEAREDGGTPGFLGAIRTALCLKLKDQMNTDYITIRERELCRRLLLGLSDIPGLHLLAARNQERLGIVSFTMENIHYNLVVQLLNDRFGIQARGGCSCAGPYGHYLLGIGHEESFHISESLLSGNHSLKPGWIRLSLHPIMTDKEIFLIIIAVQEIAAHIGEWSKDYRYNPSTNGWVHKYAKGPNADNICSLFTL
ncbi:aminotransferase class V-fold PLP-dependent enzyme [Paenibacillus sp. sgz500958]|uniref:aminotransferase class V-fold PLP-dependent enzyme n=1 Tax=Paenibacillus sp. sgz500958 TaxID=3242475 RepID=UPI0036D42335